MPESDILCKHLDMSDAYVYTYQESPLVVLHIRVSDANLVNQPFSLPPVVSAQNRCDSLGNISIERSHSATGVKVELSHVAVRAANLTALLILVQLIKLLSVDPINWADQPRDESAARQHPKGDVWRCFR